jgi:glutaredoxin 3
MTWMLVSGNFSPGRICQADEGRELTDLILPAGPTDFSRGRDILFIFLFVELVAYRRTTTTQALVREAFVTTRGVNMKLAGRPRTGTRVSQEWRGRCGLGPGADCFLCFANSLSKSINRPRLILYVKTGCPWCSMAEEYLDRHGYQYVRVDVREGRAAFDEMKRISGQTCAPTLLGAEVLPDLSGGA